MYKGSGLVGELPLSIMPATQRRALRFGVLGCGGKLSSGGRNDLFSTTVRLGSRGYIDALRSLRITGPRPVLWRNIFDEYLCFDAVGLFELRTCVQRISKRSGLLDYAAGSRVQFRKNAASLGKSVQVHLLFLVSQC